MFQAFRADPHENWSGHCPHLSDTQTFNVAYSFSMGHSFYNSRVTMWHFGVWITIIAVTFPTVSFAQFYKTLTKGHLLNNTSDCKYVVSEVKLSNLNNQKNLREISLVVGEWLGTLKCHKKLTELPKSMEWCTGYDGWVKCLKVAPHWTLNWHTEKIDSK